MKVEVYADGSSTGRADGPGGWAYVIVVDGKPLRAGCGGVNPATNNQMELRGLIEGMKQLFVEDGHGRDGGKVWLHEDRVELVSDSMIALGLTSGAYAPTTNLELVEEAQILFCRLRGATAGKLNCRHVRGHRGDLWNCRCDSLAKRGKAEVARAEG